MASRFLESERFDHLAPAQSVQELMRADGETFLRWAYYTLLGRGPDPEGMGYFLGRMAEGKSKVSILQQISRSAEGKAYGAKLPGLQRAIRKSMFKRAPVIGPVYLWLLGGNEIKRLSGPAVQ